MRMHRGSSKDARDQPRTAGNLPLSASPPATVSVVVEVARAGHVTRHRIRVVTGSLVRAAVKQVGQAPEGSAVLVDGTPIPLDTPIEGPMVITVVPTFSGG
jgi:sulfur carrier protein ThiS